jgi:putative NADH-flavin reductase
MKRIIVFGATGGSGKEVVKQAIERGYEVTAIVRNPPAFDFQHIKLKVVKADVLQLMTFENELTGSDVVISCLGTGTSLKPTRVYSAGIENIIAAMNKAGANRLICISAGALETTKEMGFLIRAVAKLLLQNIIKNPYADMRLMEKLVEKSNLDWTIIRPARLTNKPPRKNYRIAVHSHIRKPWSIARADLASFILDAIENKETLKAKVEIAY